MKTFRTCLLTYIAVILFMCVFSTSGAMIPQSAVQTHSRESADYLYRHPGIYDQMLAHDQGSKADRYADSIMLNMAYFQDASQPFRSAMSGAYYESGILPRRIEDYNRAVSEGVEANTRYTRYWHGSLPLIKIGLVFGDIEFIYMSYAVILAVLYCLLMRILYRRGKYQLMAALTAGAVAINLYCVPFSLEYAPVFLLVLSACILALYLRKEWLYPFLLAVGMLTCYFDFLTAETLAYTLPILCLVSAGQDQYFDNSKQAVLFIVRTGVIWLLGYGIAYLSKWGISALLFGSGELSEAVFNAGYRFSGAQFASQLKQIVFALMNPILALKPLSHTQTYGEMFTVLSIMGMILFGIYYLFRKEKKEKWSGWDTCILILCLIPYLRFLILNNHSSMHWFFVFRAQMITVT